MLPDPQFPLEQVECAPAVHEQPRGLPVATEQTSGVEVGGTVVAVAVGGTGVFVGVGVLVDVGSGVAVDDGSGVGVFAVSWVILYVPP